MKGGKGTVHWNPKDGLFGGPGHRWKVVGSLFKDLFGGPVRRLEQIGEACCVQLRAFDVRRKPWLLMQSSLHMATSPDQKSRWADVPLVFGAFCQGMLGLQLFANEWAFHQTTKNKHVFSRAESKRDARDQCRQPHDFRILISFVCGCSLKHRMGAGKGPGIEVQNLPMEVPSPLH